MIDALKKLLDLLDRLTWRRLVLAMAAGGMVIVGDYCWEHRDQLIPALLSSTAAQMALGVSAMVMVLSLMGSAMVTRMDRKSDSLETFLREEVTRLTGRFDQVQTTLDQVIGREADCQRELNRYRHRLERAEAALRNSGHMPPARTDRGSP